MAVRFSKKQIHPFINTLLLEIQPFYVYPLDEDEAHLCPVRAMAEWIDASKVTSGFMFRKFTAQDRPSDLEDAPMVRYLTLVQL
jgi:hypothetical protein